MAGRRPSKGLRAWQQHRDGDCDLGQDNAGADWVLGPLGIGESPVEPVVA